MSDPTIHYALVVEDDPSWQGILSEILTDSGLTVDVASTNEAAIEHLRSRTYRLATVDLSLGSDHRNKDGLSVLDAVKQYAPTCVTLLLTGYATVEIAVSALTEHGAYTCLRKETFNRGEFRDLVGQALASAAPGRPEMGSAPASPEAASMPAVSLVETALVVEDDAGWRSLLVEMLEEAGYVTRPCNSFGEALGAMKRGRYQLAVVDLSLAGATPPRGAERDLEGYRLLAAMREENIPTIVVSGVAVSAVAEQAYADYDIFAYLEKQTFDRDAFRRTVEAIQEAQISASELSDLTDRETEVLSLLARGMTNKEIADILFISTNTVKRHLKSIFEKLDVHTRSAAAAIAVSAGLPGDEIVG